MAKKLVYNYVFTPGSAGAGTISFVGSYQVKTLLLITNVTTNEIIYSFADPTKGGTTSYSDDTNRTTITLTTDTSSMTSSDDLQIFVDDVMGMEIKANSTYQDPVEKMRVSNPQALIDTDFEYSLQSTKWESVQLQNNIPGIFQRANEPAFQGADVLSVNPIMTGGGGNIVVSSGTFSEYGRSGMTQELSGNYDDYNKYLACPFLIDYIGTQYAGAYFGSNGYFTFGGGSNYYWNMQQVDWPNFPGIKVFAADRRCYWLGHVTIGTAPNRTWIVRWEGTNYSPSLTASDGTNNMGSKIYEVRFFEGGTSMELHYVRNDGSNTSYYAAQDGPGPSTTNLATWSPSTNSSSPYTTGEMFSLSWGGSATSGLRVAVSSPPATPFAVGDPIILKNTKDPLYLDGAFLITNVNSTTEFDVVSRSPETYEGDQRTDYTTVYSGGFFTNASLSISSVEEIAGTTRARITFSSNHGLYVGSKIYVVDPSASGSWLGAFVVSRIYSDTAVEYTTDETTDYGSTATVSTGTTKVYARNEGISQHRYFDGGVQINPASNSPNAQIIRQTRKYFRYQSGKGIQFSTGVLFRPVYDVASTEILTNVYAAGTNEFYDVTCKTDQEHGFINATEYREGARIRVSGYTVTSGSNPYNGEFTVKAIVNRQRFTYSVPVDPANLPTDTSPGGIPKFEVIDWNDAVVRSGLFDDQNGIFFEHDGTYLYAVMRNSTEQMAGRIEVTQNSSTVVGTDTKFLTQLKEEDYIGIKGVSYIVTKIVDDTNLTISPDYKGITTSDIRFVKVNNIRVRQENFNVDPVNGTGPSGYIFNANKMQMLFIDYSWYGAGKVRWGMRTNDGEISYVHEERQNNRNTEAYMRTGNLPGRFEISSKSKNGKLLSAVDSSSTSVDIKEDEGELLPQKGTIVINNEYIEYNKGALVGNTRTLDFQTRNIGGLNALATASINDTWLSNNQNCSPSLSHWGVSVIMDGRYDGDKSYLFTAATQNAVSVSAGQTKALVSIRLAPSVDYGIPGFYGVRNLVNRSAITLDTIGLSCQGNVTIEMKINSESSVFDSDANWSKAPNGSIAQYMDHSNVPGTFVSGDVVGSFFGEGSFSWGYSNSSYEINAIREMGNSILGGPGVYPDGPDILTLYVINNGSSTASAYGRITWTEAQG
tara:strand:- start:13406 stop:16870 length:3465 start_codon:yes stop_codon:yes gene_type:complete